MTRLQLAAAVLICYKKRRNARIKKTTLITSLIRKNAERRKQTLLFYFILDVVIFDFVRQFNERKLHERRVWRIEIQ